MTLPPQSIMAEVNRWIPGIWPAFSSAAYRAYDIAPFHVTSWWRGVDDNRRVGGHVDSQHLVALALDVTPGSAAVEAALRSVGFTTVAYSSHVHAQVLEAGVARRAGLLKAVGV